ncbi:MAG: hypothetical protein ACRDHL_13865 [Candidatus Promineifilaceae bacterium]
MGQSLIEKMLPSLEKLPLPQETGANEVGRVAYLVGLDKADDFGGDPKVLAEAIRAFQSGQSRPYLQAGVAYVLLKAAREADGRYSSEGLAAALTWLERAQALAPDLVEINFMEALIYTYAGRFEDARTVLDFLQERHSDNFRLAAAVVAYWQEQGEVEHTLDWYRRAEERADTPPQRVRLRRRLADFYQHLGRHAEALPLYKEATHFTQDDPFLWHALSQAQWGLGDFFEARRANQRALQLLDFPQARQMEQELKSKLGSGGLTGRLFGRD